MTEEAVLLGKIAILSESLASRISAGEVIERPASVVKELIENSIDAGSTRVEVDVRSGGRLLIRVQDNGEGMQSEDAILAFQRHATSKIRTDQDLQSIRTLGFRGEALPSIVAISKVRMVTVPRGENVGTEIVIEGGNISKTRETGGQPGTLMEVKEIFFNTPVRLKFLKAVSTELGHISHLIQQQALAHPQISFRLSHESKTLLDFPAVQLRIQRIQQVYGKPFSEHLIVLENQWAGIEVWGVVSKPPYTRSTRAYQEIFINNRAVSSPFILRAVYEAYEAALMKGQHPVVLLFLNVEGPMVDVNVHPAKREVRFRDQRLIHDLVRSSVKAGLKGISRADLYRANSSPVDSMTDRVREATEIYLRTRNAISDTDTRSSSEMLKTFPPSGEDEPKLTGFSDLTLSLGQLYNTYIIARIHEDFWIIDQHAAHERILYERFVDAVHTSRIPIQRLLIPQTLDLPVAQVAIVKEWLSHLVSLGLEIESFGSRSLVIRAIPTFLAKADLQDLIMDLIQDWINFEKIPSAQDRQNSLIATLACHSAIKANESLTTIEIENLLKDILQLSTAMTCPHGRPIRIKLSRKELDAMFHR